MKLIGRCIHACRPYESKYVVVHVFGSENVLVRAHHCVQRQHNLEIANHLGGFQRSSYLIPQ